ncbi:DivIVA domain-containing protein [Kribbella sp.]|uniref:DivIVA domain-containing protein n=1 Tax=Kribbella sp. TaxID=1871183 RepID=UPI002D41BEC1|nr:DivIVA domain-containing protein [Kribbella sp.]HZX05650.1 DivIVA domain-containing protein [Kribbella sp.]
MLRPQFRIRRMGQRYDCAQVDAFVERLVATAERRAVGPEVTADEIRGVAFGTPFLGPGYAVEEVDKFLAEAERWIPGVPSAPAGRVPVPGGRVAPQFTPVRLREGYAVDQVDDLVDRVMATVNGQPVSRPATAQEVREVQFRTVRLTEGYDMSEVDAFLDEAASWLDGMIGR